MWKILRQQETRKQGTGGVHSPSCGYQRGRGRAGGGLKQDIKVMKEETGHLCWVVMLLPWKICSTTFRAPDISSISKIKHDCKRPRSRKPTQHFKALILKKILVKLSY